MKILKPILLLVVLSVGLAWALPVAGQSGDIVVTSADEVVRPPVQPSSDLTDSIAGVGTRFVVQYSNQLQFFSIPGLDTTLQTRLGQVPARFIVQYANTLRHINMGGLDTTLQSLLNAVPERIIMVQAKENSEFALHYPADLINDTAPPVITQVAANLISSSAVTITWRTDEFADSTVHYGTQSGTYTTPAVEASHVITHEVGLTGLASGVTYYYRVSGTDLSGNTSQSAEYSFQTSGTPGPPPSDTPTNTPVPPPSDTPTHTSTPTPTPTKTATFTPTPDLICTPPPCATGAVLHCPVGICSGGCGVICATITPTPTDTPTATPTNTATPTLTPTPGGPTPPPVYPARNVTLVRHVAPGGAAHGVVVNAQEWAFVACGTAGLCPVYTGTGTPIPTPTSTPLRKTQLAAPPAGTPVSTPLSSAAEAAQSGIDLLQWLWSKVGVTAGDNAFDVFVNGNLAYVADYGGGLRIFNVSYPPGPVEIGAYPQAGQVRSVYVSNNMAYLAADSGGLYLVDVSNPANPVQRGHYNTLGNAFGVFVAGNIAYVATYDYGLRLIDVSNPANLTEVGAYDTPGYAWDVYVSNNIAYVADGGDGLHLIDVSHISAPVLLAGYNTPGYATGVFVEGNRAYVADYGSGVRVVDVTLPNQPDEVGYFDTPGYAWNVFARNNQIYVADDTEGLFILQYNAPVIPTPVVTDTVTPTPTVTATPTGTTVPAVPGAVSGNITGENGLPLANVNIIAYQNQAGWWMQVGTALSDAGGAYRISLPPGGYKIYFDGNSIQYRSEFYNNIANNPNAATEITVVSNQIRNAVNAWLLPAASSLIEIEGQSWSWVNPDTGEVTFGAPFGTGQVRVIRAIECAGGSPPTNVTLSVGTRTFSMARAYTNQYLVVLNTPNDLPAGVQAADLVVKYNCDLPVEVDVGQIVLYDPSGQVWDSRGNPVAGAVVNLYRVEGAQPDQSGQLLDCRTVDTRPGGATGDWSSVPDAAFDSGTWINPDVVIANNTQEISPVLNPQITGDDGRYGWDVAEGCWYVVVEANGFSTKISPLVGVPPAVTDLNIVLTGDAQSVYLPLIVK